MFRNFFVHNSPWQITWQTVLMNKTINWCVVGMVYSWCYQLLGPRIHSWCPAKRPGGHPFFKHSGFIEVTQDGPSKSFSKETPACGKKATSLNIIMNWKRQTPFLVENVSKSIENECYFSRGHDSSVLNWGARVNMCLLSAFVCCPARRRLQGAKQGWTLGEDDWERSRASDMIFLGMKRTWSRLPQTTPRS